MAVDHLSARHRSCLLDAFTAGDLLDPCPEDADVYEGAVCRWRCLSNSRSQPKVWTTTRRKRPRLHTVLAGRIRARFFQPTARIIHNPNAGRIDVNNLMDFEKAPLAPRASVDAPAHSPGGHRARVPSALRDRMTLESAAASSPHSQGPSQKAGSCSPVPGALRLLIRCCRWQTGLGESCEAGGCVWETPGWLSARWAGLRQPHPIRIFCSVEFVFVHPLKMSGLPCVVIQEKVATDG